MSVDINKVIKWFTDRQNRITYSMYGSRNGDDGTADCSGSMTQAIRDAGGKPYSYLYSTETIHPWLKDNGFKLISENATWNAKRGDVVVFGQQGASAGAGGHVGIITSNDPNAYFISTCYWTGGQAGTAVQNLPFDTMWEADGEPYFYVYRLQNQAPLDPFRKVNKKNYFVRSDAPNGHYFEVTKREGLYVHEDRALSKPRKKVFLPKGTKLYAREIVTSPSGNATRFLTALGYVSAAKSYVKWI